MERAVRILHFNTQLRPWILESAADQTLLTSNPALPRARQLARAILASPHDYDIVCLNEVFDNPAQDVLVARLEGRFPHIVVKSDLGRIVVRSRGWTALDLNPAHMLASYTFPGLLMTALLKSGPKFDDSGLMIFSRFPFDNMPLTDDVRNLYDPAAIPLRLTALGLPRVANVTFSQSRDADRFAAKGMVYAGVVLPDDSVMHVFATHTQADSATTGENRAVRAHQLAEAHEFITGCTDAHGRPLPGQTVVLGDINIVGGLADDRHTPPEEHEREWREWANSPGAPWTDHLSDVWGVEQCRGGALGAVDRGPTARTTYPPHRQRLDYAFRARTGVAALAAQHLWIDHDVSRPPRVGRDPFLSDHLPLGLDLAPRRDHNDVPTAFLVDTDDLVHEGTLPSGTVMWFRFDRAGTYDLSVNLNETPPTMRAQVYWSSDLSTPRSPYREERDPDFGDRYVVPVAPFYVKVSALDPLAENGFRFVSHRHDGTSPWSAHVLPWGWEVADHFPVEESGQDLSWFDGDETDTKWVRLDPPSGLAEPVTMSLETGYRGTAPSTGDAEIALVRWDVAAQEGHEVARFDQSEPIAWPLAPGERFYLCVQRRPAGGPPFAFFVAGWLDVGYLLASGAHNVFRARQETSGAGADDIRVTVRADDAVVWSGPERSMNEGDSYLLFADWLRRRRPPYIAYRDHLEFVVTEVDATSAHDVGRGRLPLPGAITPGAPIVGYEPLAVPPEPGRLLAQTSPLEVAVTREIAVDDGIYDAHVLLGTWTELA